uniref:BRCA1-associated protein n=1 Tax=Salmo trutta TaxID=8032 RepID=A0A673YMG5_SALTR
FLESFRIRIPLSLSGKTELERVAVLHQHIGSRTMGDMVIETFTPNPGSTRRRGPTEGPTEVCAEGTEVAPDSPSKQLPDQISFFSGNPSVEIVHGIMHLYKTNKIIRDSTSNQYMVLIKCSSQADADSFYTACNGPTFNSIEDAVCQLVYVERAEVIKSEQGAGLPVMELTELPKCTVCLERMDESVNVVLTTLCNHSFHSLCLQRWEDVSCPVCRYCQTPEPVEENKCFECGVQENLWICLICGHIVCGRYVNRHAYKHFEETQHTYAMQLTNHRVWDYAGDNYVHRLVASKTDGKMVQYGCEGETCQEEKIDTLCYSHLLTSQLESQRIYWENKIVHLEKDTAEEINNMKAKFKETIDRCYNLERRLEELAKDKQSMDRKCGQLSTHVMKLGQELKEEQEMNRCLRANQVQLQAQLAEDEHKARETGERKDGVIAELQEQLRDVMFYLETQQQIGLPPETRTEIQEGHINIGAAATPAPGPSTAIGRGRRGGPKGGSREDTTRKWKEEEMLVFTNYHSHKVINPAYFYNFSS